MERVLGSSEDFWGQRINVLLEMHVGKLRLWGRGWPLGMGEVRVVGMAGGKIGLEHEKLHL